MRKLDPVRFAGRNRPVEADDTDQFCVQYIHFEFVDPAVDPARGYAWSNVSKTAQKPGKVSCPCLLGADRNLANKPGSLVAEIPDPGRLLKLEF